MRDHLNISIIKFKPKNTRSKNENTIIDTKLPINPHISPFNYPLR